MYVSRLWEALPRVLDRVRESAERSGRTGHDVTLVAVTKGHPLEAVEAALEVGVQDIGENRVPELAAKVAALGSRAARWHMIGNVQRRKAPQLVGLCDLVHSVDSIRLAERFDGAVSPDDEPLPILIQVNTSGEPSKNGFDPDEAQEAIHRILALTRLQVRGLMTMAPFTDREPVLRDAFRGLRETHEKARSLRGYRGDQLSMGMTNDYHIAVEEGSTMIRLGTALLGERPA